MTLLVPGQPAPAWLGGSRPADNRSSTHDPQLDRPQLDRSQRDHGPRDHDASARREHAARGT